MKSMAVATLVVVVFALCLVGLTYELSGKLFAEKVATRFTDPAMAFFLLSIFAFTFGKISDNRSLLCFSGFAVLFFLVFANPLLARLSLEQLEHSVETWDPDQDLALDTLVVLGGSTSRDDRGRSQLDSMGDRVCQAARLAINGKTKTLVTTGTPIFQGEVDGPSKQTREIFLDLGIDDSRIVELEGVNTTQELRNLKARPELWENKRCGLLTSAFHLPRSIRLSKQFGLELIAVSSNDKSAIDSLDILDILPSSHALEEFALVIKECLAYFVRR